MFCGSDVITRAFDVDYFTEETLTLLGKEVEKFQQSFLKQYGWERCGSSNLHSIGHIVDLLRENGTVHDQSVCEIIDAFAVNI